MTNDDLHTLTGAYALHALEPAESAAFERHMSLCPACAQEVAELTATAARLGLAVTTTPPTAMKEQVLRTAATTRQLPPRIAPAARQSTGRAARRRAASRFALAACVAVAAGLGGVAAWQHQEAQDARAQALVTVQHTEQQAQDLAAVLAAPDATSVTGGLRGGASATVVLSHDRDRAAFITSGLPTPPSGTVYELWFDDAGTMRPAGLIDPTTTADAMLMTGPVGHASGIGITVEPAGGSTAPTSTPLALLTFPAA